MQSVNGTAIPARAISAAQCPSSSTALVNNAALLPLVELRITYGSSAFDLVLVVMMLQMVNPAGNDLLELMVAMPEALVVALALDRVFEVGLLEVALLAAHVGDSF